MSETKRTDEPNGKTEEGILCQINCPKCRNHHGNTCQVRESSCGGYTDNRMTCWACRHTWWIEGSDA